eukprot:gene14234-biopygen12152
MPPDCAASAIFAASAIVAARFAARVCFGLGRYSSGLGRISRTGTMSPVDGNTISSCFDLRNGSGGKAGGKDGAGGKVRRNNGAGGKDGAGGIVWRHQWRWRHSLAAKLAAAMALAA